MRGFVERSMSLFAAMFGKAAPGFQDSAATDKSALGRSAKQPMYRLMFCLRHQDTGRPDNPALQPLVDAQDRPLTFPTIGAAMQYQSRLGRISGDLRYYAVEVDTEASLQEPAGS